MKLKAISSSVLLALLPVSGVYAAAMDRSGQSISAFLQPNNYFEAGISVLDPSVSGKSRFGNISDMGDDYYFPTAALKLQPTEKFSFGLLYDQPFGADASYSDGRVEATGAPLAGTNVEVNSQNLTVLVGFQPNENINIYGGGAYQEVKGDLALTSLQYTATFKKDSGTGWIAGAAFQIPDIALKASLTYRSEIDHELETVEGGAAVASIPGASKDTKLTTPQSVNLDFQTGIMANTVAFANVRWVEWSSLDIDVSKFRTFIRLHPQLSLLNGGQGANIIEYSKDQWSANVGVGRKFNDQWAGNFSVGWDSGAGNPVTALGPTEGYWNVGLGAQFSPTPATFIAGGVKYFMLGDADAQTAKVPVGKFEDNDALAYGLKIGYKF